MVSSSKIYIAGNSGLVGTALTRKFTEANYEVSGNGSKQVDFRDYDSTFRALQRINPEILIIAAAKVGGIHENFANPTPFLLDNLAIQINLIKSAHELKVPRLIFLGSSCVYPKFAPQPIKEEYLLSGMLEPTNRPYAIAKIAGIELINCYVSQFGHNWTSLMPCNLYGPNDNFDPFTGHVIPGLITKFVKASEENAADVVLWGDGSPLREFLHVDDLSTAVLKLIQQESIPRLINIGSSHEISIFNLSELIAGYCGFKGSIIWDSSMPNGTPRKLLDSKIMREIGWQPTISLSEGLERTIREYNAHRNIMI